MRTDGANLGWGSGLHRRVWWLPLPSIDLLRDKHLRLRDLVSR
jgi:hypothetical protein